MSTANAKIGSATEPRPVSLKTPRVSAQRPAPRSSQDEPLLLAQIPDVDSKAAPAVPVKRPEGRIISQALSIKLIFGVGFTLVIAAILPFVFGKASRPETPVKELPEWSNRSATIASSTPQGTVPGWPSPQPGPNANIAATTRIAPEIVLPKPQQAGDGRPPALTEPAWTQPRPSAATATAYAPPPNPNYTPTANVNSPEYRGYAPAATPLPLQADSRNDPAARYRNIETRYDYRSNSTDAAAVRRDAPAPDTQRDNRYDNANSYPPAGQGSALMPSNGAAPSYRDVQNSEPGIARFDGTINPPPARTSYDRAGSSNN